MILHRNLLLNAVDPSELEPFPSRQPVLFLEVSIGADRIPGKLLLFDGDSPEEIVNCFASYYQISESKKSKLLDIVRDQLARLLQQIGEAVGSEEDDNETIPGTVPRD